MKQLLNNLNSLERADSKTITRLKKNYLLQADVEFDFDFNPLIVLFGTFVRNFQKLRKTLNPIHRNPSLG